MDLKLIAIIKIKTFKKILQTLLCLVPTLINAIVDTPNERLLLAIAAKQETKIQQALDAGASIEELMDVPVQLGDFAALKALLYVSIEMDNKIPLYAIEYALSRTKYYGHVRCIRDLQLYKTWLENMLSVKERVLVDAIRTKKLSAIRDALVQQTEMNETVEYALIQSALWGELEIVQCLLQWSEAQMALFSDQVLKKAIFVSLREELTIPHQKNYLSIICYLQAYGKKMTGDPVFDISNILQEAQDYAAFEPYRGIFFAMRSRL